MSHLQVMGHTRANKLHSVTAWMFPSANASWDTRWGAAIKLNALNEQCNWSALIPEGFSLWRYIQRYETNNNGTSTKYYTHATECGGSPSWNVQNGVNRIWGLGANTINCPIEGWYALTGVRMAVGGQILCNNNGVSWWISGVEVQFK